MQARKRDLGHLLGRTTHLTGKVLAKRFQEAKVDLTVEQFGLLLMLTEEDQLIQQELADITKKHKSAVLRMIDALEQRNLVTRSCNQQDRRKKTLAVTANGKQLIEKAQTIAQEVFTELQDGLTTEEISLFVKVALHLQTKALVQITNPA